VGQKQQQQQKNKQKQANVIAGLKRLV